MSEALTPQLTTTVDYRDAPGDRVPCVAPRIPTEAARTSSTWSPPGDDVDPNHHLWRNGNLWWVAFTVHRDDWTAHRIRQSLKTRDLEEARRRRDRLFAEFSGREGYRLSLRF